MVIFSTITTTIVNGLLVGSLYYFDYLPDAIPIFLVACLFSTLMNVIIAEGK